MILIIYPRANMTNYGKKGIFFSAARITFANRQDKYEKI